MVRPMNPSAKLVIAPKPAKASALKRLRTYLPQQYSAGDLGRYNRNMELTG
jgi:hypothetical protein